MAKEIIIPPFPDGPEALAKRLLRPVPSNVPAEETDVNLLPAPNFQNRTLFHCDNLDVLRGMNSKTVDLIATDPPFKKGRDFHATPDSLAKGASFQDRWSWDADTHPSWVEKLQEDWPRVLNVIQGSRSSYGDDMGAFLCFMGVRLIEMRRVLKDTGSIYLHCDPTASHYLKELMDAVFGKDNFQNEIIWYYDGPQRPSTRRFGTKHDVILRYSKTKNFFSDPMGIKPLRLVNEDELKDYNQTDDGRYYYDLPRGDYTDESIRRLEAEGRIRRTSRGTPRVMYFLERNERGHWFRRKQIHDVWTDIPSLGQSGSNEKTGFPTQKPIALYERILRASSAKGAVVLDPFCGCATTPIVAEKLERQWVGIDIWDKAHQVVIDRLVKERLVSPEGKASVGVLLTKGQVSYRTEPPVRTDDLVEAVPYLVPQQRTRQARNPHTRDEMVNILIERYGPICQGCLREFDDPRYFELDHNMPKSAGGDNLVENRILLCAPCNKLKSDRLMLYGLRAENWKQGFMSDRGNVLKRELRRNRDAMVASMSKAESS